MGEAIRLSELEEKIENSIRGDSSPRYRPNVLNVSELPFCHKKAFLLRKENIGTKLNGMMLSGTLFHDRLENYLKNIPDFKHAKFELPCVEKIGKLQIRGRADVVTDDTVFEFKFSAVKTGLDNLPENHMEQGNAYANMMDKPKYVIAVVNSFKLTPVLLEFKKDREAYKKFCDDAVELNNCINENRFPNNGPRTKRECTYCPVKQKCSQMKMLKEYENLEGLELIP